MKAAFLGAPLCALDFSGFPVGRSLMLHAHLSGGTFLLSGWIQSSRVHLSTSANRRSWAWTSSVAVRWRESVSQLIEPRDMYFLLPYAVLACFHFWTAYSWRNRFLRFWIKIWNFALWLAYSISWKWDCGLCVSFQMLPLFAVLCTCLFSIYNGNRQCRVCSFLLCFCRHWTRFGLKV
jgi:hypothetical protein